MRKTSNYNLSLYDSTDKMVITAPENSLNANMEIIDEGLSWLSSEKADLTYVDNEIILLKSQSGKFQPEFVNSVEECVDTTKLYVLPDGYIYAYMYQDAQIIQTKINHLSLATDTSGAICNGVGYEDGYLSSSTGNVGSKSGYSTTGFIKIGVGTSEDSTGEQIINLSGINALPTDTYVRICFYDADKNFIKCQTANAFALDSTYNVNPRYELGDDGYISLLDVSKYTYYLKNDASINKTAAFFRLCAPTFNSNTFINVNGEYTETIVEQGGYQWTNTGYTYTNESNDYTDGIPDYVKTEAEEVADKVIANRTANSLVLLTAADIHWIASEHENFENNRTAIEHLGMGMAEIRKHTRPDAVVLLGDYVYNVTPLDKTQAIIAMKGVIEKMYNATNGITSIWLDGNHDYYEYDEADKDYRLTDGEHYALVGANNSYDVEVDADNLTRNYGYIDFKKQRIRLIYLNTTDISGGVYSANYITNIQGQWLINTALDMSSKNDADKWGIVVCSHFPIYSTPFTDLKTVLSAYKDKTSGTNYGISYDFSSSTAELIATFHGHIHNFKVTDVTTNSGNVIKAICIPNAAPDRENPYTGDFQEVNAEGNEVSYPKTAGTAEDTSFNVVTIDRDNKIIYAHCYGAGYHRAISYATETITYNITTTLKNCTGSLENITTINSNGTATLTFTANDGYELPNSVVVSNATSIWNNSTGVLNISYPTGDVSVTIIATEIQTVNYTNQISISTDSAGAIYGADYNGDGINDGYKEKTRIGSDGTDRNNTATDATGFIPCTTADTLYFKNCQIAVLGGTSQTYQEIVCYDSTKKYINVRAVDKADQMSGKDYSVDSNNYLTRYNCADLWANTAFVRITGNHIGADSIIAKEPIE